MWPQSAKGMTKGRQIAREITSARSSSSAEAGALIGRSDELANGSRGRVCDGGAADDGCLRFVVADGYRNGRRQRIERRVGELGRFRRQFQRQLRGQFQRTRRRLERRLGQREPLELGELRRLGRQFGGELGIELGRLGR
jgi:hypothetical protein